MDIYAVENQEGRYLAGELEKLREIRSKGRVVVKCTPTNNAKINRFKKSFLLRHGISDVFANADQYYILIGISSISLIMIYDVCHIIYHLREEVDWKFVELEIIDIALCHEIIPNKTVIAGRAEVTAFHVLANCSITYGFHNAFHPQSSTFLMDIFDKISAADDLKKAEFGLEAKITSLIFKMT